MKILTCYPHASKGGGSSYYFKSLAKELSKNSECAILAPEVDTIDLNIQRFNWDIPFRVMGSSSTHWPDAFSYTELSDDQIELYNSELLASLKKIVLLYTPDILHIHFILPSGFAGLKLKQLFNIPVFITSHGADIKVNEIDLRYHAMSKKLLDSVDGVVGVSPDHCEWIKEVFSPNKFKVFNIPGGLELEKYKGKIDYKILHKYGLEFQNYVLGVGRFQKRKGFDLLIKSAKELTDFQIVLIGDGWEKENLLELAKEEGIDNVRFINFISEENKDELISIYKGAFATIIPSLTREETLCFVGLEAMASGSPLITTNTGGLPYILDYGKAGILIPPDNVEEIINAVRKLQESPTLRQSNIKTASEYVNDKFNWNSIGRSYLDLFNSVQHF